MCGRFTLAKDAKQLAKEIPADLPVEPRLSPRYNIAPTQPVAAWVRDPVCRMEVFTWGLVPPWAKDPSFGAKCINARAETLAEKAAFKVAYRRKRCLIPADGWIEWKRGSGPPPHPVRFHRKDNRAFTFAGLWEEWHDKEGGMILSCSIITTRPHSLARKIHPRMPAVLREEDLDPWLDPNTPLRDLPRILEPVTADDFTFDWVSTAINKAGTESPDLIKPTAPGERPDQPELF
jgi:putative SOS response-associated peptidase YedK